MSEEKDDKKEIEVINGDGSNLDISPVYEHINAAKPKSKDKNPKNIIIPDEKRKSTDSAKGNRYCKEPELDINGSL